MILTAGFSQYGYKTRYWLLSFGAIWGAILFPYCFLSWWSEITKDIGSIQDLKPIAISSKFRPNICYSLFEQFEALKRIFVILSECVFYVVPNLFATENKSEILEGVQNTAREEGRYLHLTFLGLAVCVVFVCFVVIVLYYWSIFWLLISYVNIPSMLYVNVVCNFCTLLLHFNVVRQCCISLLSITVVHYCSMFKVFVIVVCYCYVLLLHTFVAVSALCVSLYRFRVCAQNYNNNGPYKETYEAKALQN